MSDTQSTLPPPTPDARCSCRELICKVAEIHITLRKHLAKEEAQLLPLLLQHFSAAEQAELVAQFLYCIPLDTVERVLSWLKPMVPLQELQELMSHLRDVIPDRLLLQLLVTWLNPVQPRAAVAAGAGAVGPAGAAVGTASSMTSSCTSGMAVGTDSAHAAAVAAAVAAAEAANKPEQERMVICPFAAGASKVQSLQAAAAEVPGATAATSSSGQKQWPPLRVSARLEFCEFLCHSPLMSFQLQLRPLPWLVGAAWVFQIALASSSSCAGLHSPCFKARCTGCF